MTGAVINASTGPHYTSEALARVAMLIEDALRGERWPMRVDGLSANIGRPESMIRAAVERGVAAGELAITPDGHIALLRCKPAAATAAPTKTRKPRRTTK